MRQATITRETKETKVSVTVNLDGSRHCAVDTGIGFFDHMLGLFGFHAGFDLEIKAQGDLEVDTHHTVEDVGLTLGQAFRKAFGERPAIRRFGFAFVPMEETLSRVVVDISGRPYLMYRCAVPNKDLGSFETETVREFFRAFSQEARMNLHIETLYGENTHHIIESVFKSCARAVADAVRIVEGGVASTKGVI